MVFWLKRHFIVCMVFWLKRHFIVCSQRQSIIVGSGNDLEPTRRQTDYLNQWLPSFRTHLCVAKPQGVNNSKVDETMFIVATSLIGLDLAGDNMWLVKKTSSGSKGRGPNDGPTSVISVRRRPPSVPDIPLCHKASEGVKRHWKQRFVMVMIPT